MAEPKTDGNYGQFKRFTGENLCGKELRKWKLWAEAKMAASKDLTDKQRGPWVFTLLDGLALETVEHLTLEQLSEDKGDRHIWKLLEERFPDKLQHDLLAECLKEVFNLQATEGETMASWCSRVQESFAKCRRKVNVDFPTEARGWVLLNQSGLSADQRAVVTARASGELKFEVVVSSLRSCFPEFVAGSRKKSSSVYIAQNHFPSDFEDDVYETPHDAGDSVIFSEVEAFLADYGVTNSEGVEGEIFEEAEAVEILAATWKEKRTEIAKLQKSRNFRQVHQVQKQFRQDVNEVRKRSKCWKCLQVGHFARECPKGGKGGGKGSSSSGPDKAPPVSGAAMVVVDPHSEVYLVSSPGFGVVDSGCGKTLIGKETLNALFRQLADKGQTLPQLRRGREQHLFRFGNQHEELSEYAVTLPVGISGRAGKVDASVIAGTAPLLLSRGTMKSLGGVLDFERETLALLGGPPKKLTVNEAGQFVINILDFPSSSESFLIDTPCKTLTRREARCVEAFAASWSKGKSTCAVAELFSPPRFAQAAKSQGLKGLSYDLKNGHNLLDRKTQKQVELELDTARPELLVLCPECKHWGGWYRLNEHTLPSWKRIHNRRVAERQVEFCIQQARRQLKRGGRVLIEHPWSSGIWTYAPMVKLLKQMHLHKTDMCAYDLRCPDTNLPILKPTGLAVSHEDMVSLVKTCPGHEVHKVIAGKLNDGSLVSEWTAAYTRQFCDHWLSCIHSPCDLVERNQLEDSFTTCILDDQTVSDPISEILAAEVFTDEQIGSSLKRLRNSLGRPSNEDMVRVLHNAGASKEAIALARKFHCEICVQRQRPTPCLPSSAHQILDFGHRVGIDVKLLPGWSTNQKIKCLNIVDYASSFQVMCPFFETETGHVLRKIFLDKWVSWAGRPVEVITDPAQTNMSEVFAGSLELQGVRMLSTAAEAHNQLGKVEKHGHLFEVVLQKTLDAVQPRSKEENLECIVATMNSKNESLNHHGLSPNQHVFGRNPRVPEDLVQETPCPVAATAPLHSEAHARSAAVRAAARVSMAQSHDSTVLRTALNARPRAEREFLPGDFVAYWRTQKYAKGARLVGGRWYGTAIVMGKVGRNILVYHRRNMFKVSPEHLRHATLEERAVAQADGREMLGLSKYVDGDQRLQGSHYVDLTAQELPSAAPGLAEQRSAGEPERVQTEAGTMIDGPGAPDLNAAVSQTGEIPVANPSSSSGIHRSEPFQSSITTNNPSPDSSYGPVRRRYSVKSPEDPPVRPPELLPSDFIEAHREVTQHKRQASRDLSSEPPNKAGKTIPEDEDLLVSEVLYAFDLPIDEDEVFTVTEQEGESAEVFMANFLKKKQQSPKPSRSH